MVSKRRRGERLVAVAIVGLLVLNYPLLGLFDQATLVFGIPALFLYLFLAWALLIGLIAWALAAKGTSDVENLGAPPHSGE